jgi:hypothetical protein
VAQSGSGKFRRALENCAAALMERTAVPARLEISLQCQSLFKSCSHLLVVSYSKINPISLLPLLSLQTFEAVSGRYESPSSPSFAKMWTPYFLFLSAIISSAAVEATTLIEALQGAGASEFATRIESDPTVAAVFFSSDVQTVFAPIDGCAYPSQRKGKRQTNNQNLLYHGIKQSNKLGDMSAGSGKPMQSNDKSANLDGAGQSAVSNPLNVTQSNVAKRWASSPLRRNSHSNTTSTPSLLKIFTGLGNNVNIIQADILYDGGVLHIVDS